MSFVVAIGMVAGSLLNAAVTHRRLADRSYQRERAFAVAEAGFEKACQAVADRGELLSDPFYTNGTINGATFACCIDRWPDNFTYQIVSTGTANNVRWTVRADRVETPSWAKYALWMDINGTIYFVGGEEFFGHVHSNSKLFFSSTADDGADFYDHITSTTNVYGGTISNATFHYGLELGAPQDSMASVDFADLRSKAVTAGTVLTGHTYIVFSGTTMRVTNQREGWTNRAMTIGTNNIIYVQTTASGGSTTNREGRVFLSGTVDGRITVVNEEDAYILNHIQYANFPTNAGCDDALGIVSKDDIWVATNAPNNLNIHAAMMATGLLTNDAGSFGVVNHNTGAARGDLNVWGSIVQEQRGAVGTFNASGIATGFSKRYGYDARLRRHAPPFYPRLATKLEVDNWREGPS